VLNVSVLTLIKSEQGSVFGWNAKNLPL